MKRLEKIAREQATFVAEILADNCCVDEEGSIIAAPCDNCGNCIFEQNSDFCNPRMTDWLLEEVAE